MGRRWLSFKERNPESQVRFRMNEHEKVLVDQSKVLMAVGTRVVLELRFLGGSRLGEPVFQLLKHLQKISCGVWSMFVLRLFQDPTVRVSGNR